MGELLPPALRGQGGRGTVSGALQPPPDTRADPARRRRPGMGRARAGRARELRGQGCNLDPHPGPRSAGASIRRVFGCVCPARLRLRVSKRLGSPARVPPPPDPRDAPAVPEIGTPRRPRCVLATGTPTRRALGPSQCLRTPPPPARWPARPPRRLRPRGRARTGRAPPAAPPRPDHTHVRRSRGRRSRGPGEAAEPVQCPPPPLTPRWSSVTQGSARPHPTHSSPPPPPAPAYPHGQGQHSRYSGHLLDAVSSPFPRGRTRTWRRTGAVRR